MTADEAWTSIAAWAGAGMIVAAATSGPTILPGVALYDVMGFGLPFAGSILLLRVLISFARTQGHL